MASASVRLQRFVGGGQVSSMSADAIVGRRSERLSGATFLRRRHNVNLWRRPTKVSGLAQFAVALAALLNSHLLVYGGGGFAYGRVKQAGLFNEYGDTQTGWTAGGGVEWAPAAFPKWSAKVEYLYTSLSNNGGNAYFAGNRGDTRFHTVRAG
jgi:opacity protein-like surface antigen